MSRPLTRCGSRLAIVILWLVVTGGVAFLIAHHEANTSATANDPLTAPPVRDGQRQTVTLAQHSIQPVISGDGRVAHDPDGVHWMLEAPVTPEAQAYQLLQAPAGVKALIVGGPAGFDCPWLGLGQAGDGNVTMRCRIPDNVPVVAGLSGTMVLAMSPPVEVMALPVTAVVGTSGRGQVVVVGADGKPAARPVTIGRSDTFWIEITGGLQPNEPVFTNPVQADFAGQAS